MKDIIIIGTGKAAWLHTRAYLKIKNVGRLFYVDITEKINNSNLKINKIYKCIEDVILENHLLENNIIVDICTPEKEFYKIIDKCKILNLVNIIVEKPFVYNNKRCNGLKILMIQNYLYSNITSKVSEYIKDTDDIEVIYTNFSKSRINDSRNERGMSNKITSNFEIEIPHQLYIVDHLLNSKGNLSIMCSETNDYQINNLVLENHGYGKVIMKYKDTIIIFESDLITCNTKKQIIFIMKNKVIEANYIIYDKDLFVAKNGSVIVKENGKNIYENQYSFDDNMYECIDEYYKLFNNNYEINKYIKRMNSFTKIFEKIMKEGSC